MVDPVTTSTGSAGRNHSTEVPLEKGTDLKTMTASHDLGSMSIAPALAEGAGDTELPDQHRRRFLRFNLFGLAVASTAGLFVGENAWAIRQPVEVDNEPAILDPKDPEAQALQFTRQTEKDRQSCANCQLYTGTDGAEFGPCAIFSYRVTANGKQIVVVPTGWCRAWGARQEG